MKVGHPLAMLDPRGTARAHPQRPTLLRTPVKKGKVTEAKIEQEINQENQGRGQSPSPARPRVTTAKLPATPATSKRFRSISAEMSVGQRVGATTIRAAKILEESLTEEGADETRTFENLPLGGPARWATTR
jgi:hypothetical protein